MAKKRIKAEKAENLLRTSYIIYDVAMEYKERGEWVDGCEDESFITLAIAEEYLSLCKATKTKRFYIRPTYCNKDMYDNAVHNERAKCKEWGERI